MLHRSQRVVFEKKPVEKYSTLVRIYIRKSQEKNLWKKKPGNRNVGTKSQFSEVLGQNVTGNKVLGIFLPIKSLEIRLQKLKS